MDVQNGKITAIWLDSGKKLTVSQAVMDKGNFVVRSGEHSMLLIPAHKVQSVEVEYPTKEEVDEVFK